MTIILSSALTGNLAIVVIYEIECLCYQAKYLDETMNAKIMNECTSASKRLSNLISPLEKHKTENHTESDF